MPAEWATPGGLDGMDVRPPGAGREGRGEARCGSAGLWAMAGCPMARDDPRASVVPYSDRRRMLYGRIPPGCHCHDLPVCGGLVVGASGTPRQMTTRPPRCMGSTDIRTRPAGSDWRLVREA